MTVILHFTAFADTAVEHGVRVLSLPHHPDDRMVCELIFEQCNSGAGDITRDQVYTRGRCWSLSVGDVVQIEGRFYVCAGAGFKEVTRGDFMDMLTHLFNGTKVARDMVWELEEKERAALRETAGK